MSSNLASQNLKSSEPSKIESRKFIIEQAETTVGNPAEKKALVTFNGRTRDEIVKAHTYGKKIFK